MICRAGSYNIFFLLPADDFAEGFINVAFPAGENAVSFDISVVDDLIDEDTEFFRLSIVSVSSGTISPTLNEAQAAILDNDDSMHIRIHCTLTGSQGWLD